MDSERTHIPRQRVIAHVGFINTDIGIEARPTEAPSLIQVVFIERGRMRTQERGKSVQEFGPGALVRTEPDVVHWHGALPGDSLTQVALSFGVTNWLQPVSDAEYSAR